MLLAVYLATLLLGLALLYTKTTKHPVMPRVRIAHRTLAVASVGLAVLQQATLLWGSALIVAGLGVASARLKDEVWATVLLFAHLAGALLLLIIAGMTG